VSEPVNASDYLELAAANVDPAVWCYFEGGAGDEVTLRANTERKKRTHALITQGRLYAVGIGGFDLRSAPHRTDRVDRHLAVIHVFVVEAERARPVCGQDPDDRAEGVEQGIEQRVVLLSGERNDVAVSACGLQGDSGERGAAARTLRRAVDDVDRQVAQHGHARGELDAMSRHRSVSWVLVGAPVVANGAKW